MTNFLVGVLFYIPAFSFGLVFGFFAHAFKDGYRQGKAEAMLLDASLSGVTTETPIPRPGGKYPSELR